MADALQRRLAFDLVADGAAQAPSPVIGVFMALVLSLSYGHPSTPSVPPSQPPSLLALLPPAPRYVLAAKGELIMRADAEFDLIIHGATGFTGRLVAEHLQSRYGSSGAGQMGDVRPLGG
jgi:hypothetical protein